MSDYRSDHPAPQAMRQSEPSPSQVTACHRCRKQKLRCSRETPSCKRCQDISAVCTYPPPPDRKLLAAQRAQNAKARSLRESGSSGEQRDYTGSKSSDGPRELSPSELPSTQPASLFRSDHARRSLSGESQSSTLPNATLFQVSFPSEELALTLIDTYFSHLYNSTLLFHKQSLVPDYLAGKVPDFVILSVFALGAIFLSVSTGRNLDISMTLAGSQRPGEDWARAASQQALMHADQPRYETVQACQTLAMYWFAFGRTDRTNMHYHIAYRTSRLLGYANLLLDEENGVDPFHVELRRRAFWASWSMGCLAQNNASFKAESWKEAIGLPLPCDEGSFADCQPISKEAFDKNGHLQILTENKSELARTSYMGEIIKLLSVWWEISRFAKKFVDAGQSDSLARMSQLQELDQQLELVRDNLHPDFQYTDITSFASRDIAHSYQLFAVQTLYHLCVCILHSSIVPVFSNIPPDARISRKLTRMSADEAVKHSQNLISLATDLLGVHSDKSRCPSFAGYAMFVAVSIQFKSLGAQGLLRGDGVSKLYPAIAILECIKRVWRTQEALWIILENLFRGGGLDINRLSDTRQLLALAGPDPNLDQIAAHGVVDGGPDMYTYVADEEPISGSSRRSSPLLSRGDSPMVHVAASMRQSPTVTAKQKEHHPSNLSNPAQRHMPVPRSQDSNQVYWSTAQTQPYALDQGVNPPHPQDISSNAPMDYMPIDSVSRSSQDPDQTLQNQLPDMGYMGVDISMGIDNMDLDTSSANLWWDRPFEAIPTDQYRWWYVGGAYEVPAEGGYYRDFGQK